MGWMKINYCAFLLNNDTVLVTTKCTADVEHNLTFQNGYIAILSGKSPVEEQKFKIKFVSKLLFDL